MEAFLGGDIGGTNSRLSLFVIDSNDKLLQTSLKNGNIPPGQLLLEKKYHNEGYSSFSDVLRHFIQETKFPGKIVTACIAFAGPVKDNKAKLTNRGGWEIDGNTLQAEFGIAKVMIVNDFLAVGYGLLTLNEATECICLHEAPKQKDAPIACIGAGTGLGECFLTPDGCDSYRCFPSEGGHAEFAPRNELETELLSYLKHKFEQKHRVSVERVVSGIGLANVYEFLSTKFPDKVDLAVHHKIETAGEMRGAIIAQSTNCELCRLTMEIFATAYGAEAGVAALKWMPFGGLYLTGGLTPKNIDLIRSPDGPFLHALFDKGRVSGMLIGVPIYAVMIENVGERGAHFVAYQEYQKLRRGGATESTNTECSRSACPFNGTPASCLATCKKSSCCSKVNLISYMTAAAMLALAVLKNH